MNVKSLVLALGIAGVSVLQQVGVARAAQITFTFDGNDDQLPTIKKTVEGTTITLDNPNNAEGYFLADGDGLLLGPDTSRVSQFDIFFDKTIKFISYTIGFVNSETTGTFDLSNPNGTGSTGNPLNPVGIYSFNNPFTLLAGQTATLNAFFLLLLL